MSSFFTTLAARSQHRLPALQPRLAFHFEPPGASGLAAAETFEWDVPARAAPLEEQSFVEATSASRPAPLPSSRSALPTTEDVSAASGTVYRPPVRGPASGLAGAPADEHGPAAPAVQAAEPGLSSLLAAPAPQHTPLVAANSPLPPMAQRAIATAPADIATHEPAPIARSSESSRFGSRHPLQPRHPGSAAATPPTAFDGSETSRLNRPFPTAVSFGVDEANLPAWERAPADSGVEKTLEIGEMRSQADLPPPDTAAPIRWPEIQPAKRPLDTTVRGPALSHDNTLAIEPIYEPGQSPQVVFDPRKLTVVVALEDDAAFTRDDMPTPTTAAARPLIDRLPAVRRQPTTESAFAPTSDITAQRAPGRPDVRAAQVASEYQPLTGSSTQVHSERGSPPKGSQPSVRPSSISLQRPMTGAQPNRRTPPAISTVEPQLESWSDVRLAEGTGATLLSLRPALVPLERTDRANSDASARLTPTVEPRISAVSQIREDLVSQPSGVWATRMRVTGPTPRSTVETEAAPTIQVRIGRIEVRAAPPAPAAPKSRPPAPPVSLAEYLRQRAEGGHR
jgi:hypothetical protein